MQTQIIIRAKSTLFSNITKRRSTIGLRVRKLRKQKGYNQQELANLLGKFLRTVQKYENGEINISVAMINEIARVPEVPSTYLPGYKKDGAKIECLSDIMDFLFCLEKVSGIKFDIDVKRPPHFDGWECSLKFNGKDMSADYNASPTYLKAIQNQITAIFNYAVKYYNLKRKTLPQSREYG